MPPVNAEADRSTIYRHSKKLETVTLEFQRLPPHQRKPEVFERMCSLVGISAEIVKRELRLVRLMEEHFLRLLERVKETRRARR